MMLSVLTHVYFFMDLKKYILILSNVLAWIYAKAFSTEYCSVCVCVCVCVCVAWQWLSRDDFSH